MGLGGLGDRKVRKECRTLMLKRKDLLDSPEVELNTSTIRSITMLPNVPLEQGPARQCHVDSG